MAEHEVTSVGMPVGFSVTPVRWPTREPGGTMYVKPLDDSSTAPAESGHACVDCTDADG